MDTSELTAAPQAELMPPSVAPSQHADAPRRRGGIGRILLLAGATTLLLGVAAVGAAGHFGPAYLQARVKAARERVINRLPVSGDAKASIVAFLDEQHARRRGFVRSLHGEAKDLLAAADRGVPEDSLALGLKQLAGKVHGFHDEQAARLETFRDTLDPVDQARIALAVGGLLPESATPARWSQARAFVFPAIFDVSNDKLDAILADLDGIDTQRAEVLGQVHAELDALRAELAKVKPDPVILDATLDRLVEIRGERADIMKSRHEVIDRHLTPREQLEALRPLIRLGDAFHVIAG